MYQRQTISRWRSLSLHDSCFFSFISRSSGKRKENHESALDEGAERQFPSQADSLQENDSAACEDSLPRRYYACLGRNVAAACGSLLLCSRRVFIFLFIRGTTGRSYVRPRLFLYLLSLKRERVVADAPSSFPGIYAQGKVVEAFCRPFLLSKEKVSIPLWRQVQESFRAACKYRYNPRTEGWRAVALFPFLWKGKEILLSLGLLTDRTMADGRPFICLS